MYKRILLKLSGEALSGQGTNFDPEILKSLASQIKEIEMNKVAEPFIARRAIRHLEKGRVVIFGAGTGSPFFSTDTTAALRASEIKADVILMAKNGVDGVYSADPKLDPNAVKYDRLTYMDLIQKGLAVMDTTATSMCMDNHIDLIVFNMNQEGNIKRAVMGESIGTIVE